MNDDTTEPTGIGDGVPVEPAIPAAPEGTSLEEAPAVGGPTRPRPPNPPRPPSSFSVELRATTREAIRLALSEAAVGLREARAELRAERLSREESRQRTRERLLDAAGDVFNRLGYHGASLEAVAEAAGYTKGAVYSNFATKGELFAALLRRFTERRLAEQGAIMDAISLEQLADGAGAMLEQQRREEGGWDLLQIEFWLAAMRDPQLLPLLSEGSEELYKESAELLGRKIAEAGLEPALSGYELARVVNALGTGLLLQLYVEPDRVDPDLFGRALRVLVGLPPRSSAEATPE